MLAFACLAYCDTVFCSISAEIQIDVLVFHKREDARRALTLWIYGANPLTFLGLIKRTFDVLAGMDDVLLFFESLLYFFNDELQHLRTDTWFLISDSDIWIIKREGKLKVFYALIWFKFFIFVVELILDLSRFDTGIVVSLFVLFTLFLRSFSLLNFV